MREVSVDDYALGESIMCEGEEIQVQVDYSALMPILVAFTQEREEKRRQEREKKEHERVFLVCFRSLCPSTYNGRRPLFTIPLEISFVKVLT